MDGTGLDRAFDLSMGHHFDGANLGEADAMVVGDAEARLGIGETIVAPISLKTWVAGFVSRLVASEKGLEGQIDPHRDILHHLGMHLFERRILFFQHRIGLLLLEAREGNAITLVGRVAHFQQLIIQEATRFKVRLERSQLFLRRIDPVSIVFQHCTILSFNETEVKKMSICPIPSRHQKERPFIPHLKDGGFLARFCNP
jgi:hypothetical protein